MNLRPPGRTGLEIAPLVFATNVFGCSADQPLIRATGLSPAPAEPDRLHTSSTGA